MTQGAKTILVIGATGRQGGAVATKLLADGWRSPCVTRNPASAAAQELEHAGAEVVSGDMADRASLEGAMQAVHGVFSVQQTVGSPGAPSDFDTDDEIAQGKTVADVAKSVGVAHFVYASVGGAEPGIRHP